MSEPEGRAAQSQAVEPDAADAVRDTAEARGPAESAPGATASETDEDQAAEVSADSPIAAAEAHRAAADGGPESVSGPDAAPAGAESDVTDDAEPDDADDADDAADSAAETSGAPDLTSDDALDAALEALLLVVDIPAGEELLASTLQQPVARVRTALHRLSASYAEHERGLDLRRIGDGWRFYTREKYAAYVERYLLDGQRTKLTRAALETLAVIAYRQPVTRAKVSAVRGVNVDGVVRTLVGRGLIEEVGTDPETGGTLYCTTELFLERLGLSSLKDLPPLAPLLPEVDSIDDV
ncbi:SMC-Scp complex subunit ScpB [Saccharopolyspora halophila]|uniref:SMC-Scp complex subunit ScpB n=1 Tax=Saccharopolyspora halophila TaxID=405551 RepID=A0ABN3G5S1_9PSEU